MPSKGKHEWKYGTAVHITYSDYPLIYDTKTMGPGLYDTRTIGPGPASSPDPARTSLSESTTHELDLKDSSCRPDSPLTLAINFRAAYSLQDSSPRNVTCRIDNTTRTQLAFPNSTWWFWTEPILEVMNWNLKTNTILYRAEATRRQPSNGWHATTSNWNKQLQEVSSS